MTLELERRGNLVYGSTDWPEELQVDRQLLRDADPRYVVQHGTRIDFTVENGHAVYKIVRDDSREMTVHLRRISSAYEPVDWRDADG